MPTYSNSHHHSTHIPGYSSSYDSYRSGYDLPSSGRSSKYTTTSSSTSKRSPILRGISRDWDEAESDEIRNQAYRTFPIITPSVKVKRDLPQGSWLKDDKRHEHSSRKKDHHVEFAIDKNRSIVNRQFNSPIGLYSKDNMNATLAQQTGYTSTSGASSLNKMRPTVQYDPSKSATFMAILDMENPGVREEKPAAQKVYTAPRHTEPTWVGSNPLGGADYIQQSGSFKRVMAQVMGDTDF